MNSSVLSSQLASEIITNCPNIGSVIFNAWRSDWIAEYGLMPGNLVRPFHYPAEVQDEQRTRLFAQPQWGEMPCL